MTRYWTLRGAVSGVKFVAIVFVKMCAVQFVPPSV
jgi:hypothetical protein